MWGKFEYRVFCSLSQMQNLKHKETLHFPFHGWEISNQGGNVEKSICNPKLFVPLVKVINSMLEQNLHRLHFHKILKLWVVSINFERWVRPSEIVRYRVKLEWWIKFKRERNSRYLNLLLTLLAHLTIFCGEAQPLGRF